MHCYALLLGQTLRYLGIVWVSLGEKVLEGVQGFFVFIPDEFFNIHCRIQRLNKTLPLCLLLAQF